MIVAQENPFSYSPATCLLYKNLDSQYMDLTYDY